MNLTIEIENKEDFPFIKKLLESLKGVKIVDQKYAEDVDDFLPLNVQEALENYADNLKDEDMISHEDFINFIEEERCKLGIVK